jgi:SPP1 gp7 family putative phage head morphogenesis protein
MSEKFLLEPTPHAEAIDFIRSKPAVASRVLGQLLPELRARAFTISGVEHYDTLQHVRDLVAEIPAGADWDTTKAQIVDEVSPFFVGKLMGHDDEGNPIRLTAAEAREHAARRAELLLRLHGFQAYAASAYRTMDAQRDVFPFWKYQSMGDLKVRATHAALDGKILPADSDFWKNHYPPWEWGCRCQVVPMMEDEVADARAAEAHRPLEQRDVLEGHALAKVEQERTLVLGPNQIYDLRTQRERGNPNGYEWHPGELRIPMDALRARYDAPVWAQFETWARAEVIPETGATVWEWLGGKALAPTGKLATTIATTQAARLSPVSRAITVQGGGKLKNIVATTLAAIDAVHDDGKLPPIPVDAKPSAKNLGEYRLWTGGGIGIRLSGPWPRLTAAHEVAHFIDHRVLDQDGRMASDTSPVLAALIEAADRSAAIQWIKSSPLPLKRRAYFLQRHEIFARAYAQWIALRSGDADLLADLKRLREGSESWRQWTDEDFEPVAAELDALFIKKGWK